MRVSLSTSVRAVNLITPYCGSGETGFSTTTAARPVSRPWSHRSYCGWKTENVWSPLVSCRGHGSTSTFEVGDDPSGIADMQPDRPGRTSANTSADSALLVPRSPSLVIRCLPRAPLPLPGLGPVSGLVRFGWRVRPVRVPALF